MKMGLRSNMGLRMNGNQQQSQTQWLCMRQQILARRVKNTDNVMGMVVSRNHSHTEWEDAMNGMVAQFIASVADLRIPNGDPDGRTVVKCLPVKADRGWLLDADIKTPRIEPAEYSAYKGDRRFALWFPDRDMAMKVWEYNQQGWSDPDPTAGWPAEKRFLPEASLSDLVDSWPPQKLTWTGEDGGLWDTNTPCWRDIHGRKVAWDPRAQAVFESTGMVVRLAGDVVCSGLKVGKGYTLALGPNSVSSLVSVVLEEGSILDVTLRPDEANSRRGVRVSAAGNAKVAGTLILRGEKLKPGLYDIVRANSRNDLVFGKVVVPAGWEGKLGGGSVSLSAKQVAK
jgi:hypothetical protein